MHTLKSLLLICTLSVTITACDSSDPDPPPGDPTGTLEVSVATTGDTPDPNGYTVTLDGAESREVDPDGTVIFEDVAEGNHELEFSGVQVNCTPDGGAMQAVTVTAEETTSTTFNVACEAALFDQIVFASDRLGDHRGNFSIFAMGTDGSSPAPVGGGVEVWTGQVDVSPDGTQILFDDLRTENVDVFVMSVGGSEAERLTEHSADDDLPSWSPDGERIAFTSNRGGSNDIFVMNADGTGVTRLTDDPAFDGDPSWSPDGEHIAFHSRRDGGSDIFVMNADGTEITRLTDNADDDRHAAWFPDGERIVFVSNRDGIFNIYVMNADGTDVTLIETDNLNTYEAGLSGAPLPTPKVSPDGERIAFTSVRDGQPEVYTIGVDGTGIERLTDDPAQDGDPTWTPARMER